MKIRVASTSSYFFIVLFAVCLFFSGCIPEEIELPVRIKSVVTHGVSNVGSHSATLFGNISLYDSENIACGFIYNTSSNLSHKSGVEKSTRANGDYVLNISGLKANTIYYYRAYGVDAGQYKYGEIRSFKTGVAVVTDRWATNITHNGATLSGTVISSNKYVSCGIIYGTSSDLSSTSGIEISTFSSGSFSVDITGLSSYTTYYYRAYAIVDGKYWYGEICSFTTKQNVSVTTGGAANITYSSATLSGSIVGAYQSLTCGIIYGTSSSLSSSNGTKKSTTSRGSYSISVTGLSANTTYYYCAYAIVDGEYKYGEVRSFTTESSSTVTSGDAIDLGLSVKWASCNVGADSPEEYGNYVAWGETRTKSDYSSSTSVTYGLSISELKSRGVIDAAGNLTAAYDAATANWGEDWRMPTLDEMEELVNECEWEWTSVNGVNGQLVTGPNGNSIFLPAAGYRDLTSLDLAGSYGAYWSATPYSGSSRAYHLGFGSGYYNWWNDRYNGQAVRPVSEE